MNERTILNDNEMQVVGVRLNEALDDGEVIANAAICLLLDRTDDLDLSPLFPLLALKKLLAVNLDEAQKEFKAMVDCDNLFARISDRDRAKVVKALTETIEAEYAKRVVMNRR